LTTFKDLLKEAGLDSESNVTWFAPRESAFEDVKTKELLEKLREDPEKLRQVLLYHSTQPMMEDLTRLPNKHMVKTRANDKTVTVDHDPTQVIDTCRIRFSITIKDMI